MKRFAYLPLLLSAWFAQNGAAFGAPEYSHENLRTVFSEESRDTQKAAALYSAVVFGVHEETRHRAKLIPAFADPSGQITTAAVRFGGPIDHRDHILGASPSGPNDEEPATPWWAVAVIAFGLVFYQVRRPVRPRIGTR